MTGLEIGEPHWFPDTVAELLANGPFDRILGSLHSLTMGDEPRLIDEWYRTEQITGDAEATAVRDYLTEAVTMTNTNDDFEVFAHIDYLVRQIHHTGRTHDPRDFEENREALRALARSGRVLEINTKNPLDPIVVTWWHQLGGPAVTVGLIQTRSIATTAHRGPRARTNRSRSY